ncbi:MAG: M3 family metallopeptidase, partial [Campylobacterota bacterium]|nr:M3 family metallopeptidase [Campylobacterota bacterium]
AALNKEKKSRLSEINLRKSELANEFSQNLIDATNEYELIVCEDDVDGMSENEKQSAAFDDNGETKYKFTLQMPSYIAYMTYGKNSEIREKLYKAYTTRSPQNALIIDELLALRQEMAQLLGFENYAQYSLASKMAKDSSEVVEFLEHLALSSYSQAKNELEELLNFHNIEKINSFDSAYYSEILKKRSYDIDEELYRPYFEQQNVVNGMFTFLEKLFGIKFVKTDESYYDEKVTSYDLHVDDTLRARLYLDLDARKGKRGGAWMHNHQTHCIDENGEEILASAFVVCNFPSSLKSASLLRHDDVVTLFHEMGHAIHHLLSRVNENSVSGVNGVEWDAVEFPSQFLENFAYEKSVLKMFALHVDSHEVISDEMCDKLIKVKNFQSALGMLRQLEFSLFDFKLHEKLYSADEVQNLLDGIREKTALIKPPSYNKFQNGFSHIFAGGYAAGYYSYKYAEVLSADMFFKVVDEAIFGSDVAKKYLDVVLSNGGAYSMSKLFIDIMGKKPDVSSLLRLNGIES